MPRIHILPPDVVSKIAAGEVIDRPASVIKELIENSIDAKSEAIELTLKNAGKTLIHIKDDGTGIHPDDINSVFHRHSTSKIERADDLFNIHSLGFRGEALYSVAAVADVILRSKQKDQDSGWEIHTRGGENIDQKPTALTDGTELEIRELFFNTPARRKFLKSDTAEINQVLNVFIPYCLLYPEIRFKLTHQGKTMLSLEPADHLKSRIARTLHFEEKHLIDIQRSLPEKNISVRMVLGDINIARSRRDTQFIFINDRPVQNKNISYHLNNIYRLILPQGQSPFFSVYIGIPAADVDVNIHPSKREVKIRDEQSLMSVLRSMCETALMSSGRPKQAGNAAAKLPPEEGLIDINRAMSVVNRIESVFNHEKEEKAWDDDIPYGVHEPTPEYSYPQTEPPALSSPIEDSLFPEGTESLQARLTASRYIGSFINKFLLFESGGVLLVVDQHAAQERITFEHLIRQMEKGKIEVQHLLSPYLLKMTPQDLIAWEEAREKLDAIGFSSTQFDDETIAVHTYPVLIKDPARAVKNLLAGDNPARCDFVTIARRACRSSVMAGDSLTPEQAVFQRDQLIKCKDPFTCPHGRPTVIEMSESFLDKQFLRT